MSRRLGSNYWKLWTASVVSNFGDGLGVVAYPWLASAVTRSPVHIALVTVATRLPWLLFTLPAGVITDRVDRRLLVAWMDVIRFILTLGVAFVVLASQGSLASPDAIASGAASPPAEAGMLLLVIYVSSLLLGTAEVLRDNSAQTLMPAIVDADDLERANGRLWGAEMIMNSFAGPPAAGFLLAIAFSLPFFVDAGTFAVSAALIFAISGQFRARAPDTAGEEAAERPTFWDELKEGVRWLWGHDLFRPMAIALGVMNGLLAMTMAVYVLFVQEVLDLGATGFGALMTAGAAGGVAGTFLAAPVSKRLGQGASLFFTVIASAITLLITGLTSSPVVVWTMFAIESFAGMVWNVITVSLRQALIPDRMLGRVNSVYRFLGWGMMPIGTLIGGLIVAFAEPSLGREWALRAPFIAGFAICSILFVYVYPRLNSARITDAKTRDSGDTGLTATTGDER